MKKCHLCEHIKTTHLIHEDKICYICDCSICGHPVVALKTHRKPIKNELEHMLNKTREIFNMQLNAFNFSIKENTEHFHFHLTEFKGGASEPFENHYF